MMKGHGVIWSTARIRKRANDETATAKVPIEAMRDHQIRNAPITITTPPTSGEIASVVAAVVMPPAPPLKPLRNDQLWPITAKPPASASARFMASVRITASSTDIVVGSGKTR